MSTWAPPNDKCLTHTPTIQRTFSHTSTKNVHGVARRQQPYEQIIQTCPTPALLRAVFSGASPPNSGLLPLYRQKCLKLPVALHHNQQLAHNNSKLLPLHQRSTTRPRNNIHALRQSGKTPGHLPAPQHSTKNGHFRQPGLAHQYIQCSFCGFAQKLPRTTAHPLANKIYKQHRHTSTLYHQQQPPLPNIQANARKAKCQTVVRLCCCLNFVNGCSCSRAYPASGAWDMAPQAKNKQRTAREGIVSA